MKNLPKILGILLNIIAFYLCAVFMMYVIFLNKEQGIGIQGVIWIAVLFSILFCAVRNYKKLSLNNCDLKFSSKEIIILFIAILLLNTDINQLIYGVFARIVPDDLAPQDPANPNTSIAKLIFLGLGTWYAMAITALWYYVIKTLFFRKSCSA